jgi:CBS domain-containing membrane protein
MKEKFQDLLEQNGNLKTGDKAMLTVSDLMTTQIFSLLETDTLYAAKQIMEMARIRHVPIVDEKQHFIGLITHRDMLSVAVSRLSDIDEPTQNEIAAGIPLREIMRRDVTTISPETTLREAAEKLLLHKYGCLPVVDPSKKLVGILTEADFLRLTISLMDALETRA